MNSKKWARLLIIAIGLAPALLQANACPFVSHDSGISGLVTTTRNTLAQLETTKNECSEQFIQSINGVRNLPMVIDQAYNPIGNLLHRKRYLQEQLAEAQITNDPNVSTSTLEVMLSEVEQEIVTLRSENAFIENRYTAERDALRIVSSLLDTLTQQVQDPNSECGKHLTENFSSQIMTLGLGTVSAIAPALAGAGGTTGSIALIAGILSKIANFRSKGPSKSLKKYDKAVQTADLACLYHNIVNTSCKVRESFKREKGIADRDPILAYIDKLKNKTPDWKKFEKILLSERARESGKVVAAASNLLLNPSLSGGDDSALQEFSTGIRNVSAGSNELARYQSGVKRLALFDQYLAPETFDGLDEETRDAWRSRADDFLYYLQNYEQMSGDLKNDMYGDSIEYFRKHSAALTKIFKKRVKDYGGDNSSALTDPTIIFGLYDWRPVAEHLTAILRGNASIKSLIHDFKEKSPDRERKGKVRVEGRRTAADRVAYNHLEALNRKSTQFAETLFAWTELDPIALGPTLYKERLMDLTKKLNGQAGIKNNSTKKDLALKVENILFAPVQKLVQISQPQSGGSLSLTNPDPAQKKKLNPWTEYRMAYDLLRTLNDKKFTTADRSAITMARDLFEGNDSMLRENLTSGILDLIGQIKGSSDPKAIEDQVANYCALALSIPPPKVSGPKPLDPCLNYVKPKYLELIFGSKNRKRMGCAYFHFEGEKSRSRFLINKDKVPKEIEDLHNHLQRTRK